MLKDLLISISLVNLWFMDIWKLFLIRDPTTYPYYHWKLNPASLLLATMLDVLLLSALLFLAISLVRRLQNESALRIAQSVFAFVFVILAANLLLIAVRNHSLGPLLYTLIHRPHELLKWRGITSIYSWLAILILLASWVGISMMIHSLIFRRQKIIRLSATLLLITSPFVVFTFTQAASQFIRYRTGEQFRDKTAATFSQRASYGRRILWIIFDEFDFRLSFLERPATLKLPEFDKLRNESIFAHNAYPPGAGTVISLPALINGRFVSFTNRTAPNEVLLTFADDGQGVMWSTQPNVFSRARAMGLNTGLTGWYHPYCRIIGSNLTRCSWQAASLLFLNSSDVSDLICYSEDIPVARGMLRVAGSVLRPEILRLIIPRQDPHVWRNYSSMELNSIHQQALAMATDPNLDLILVHYSIPHPPGIYDRYKHQPSNNSSSGYLDNLALADRILSQLRDKMTKSGIWDNTTVIISSDHGLQAERVWKDHLLWKPSFTKEDPLVWNSKRDERVPFLLKLAGGGESLEYEPAFNTVLSSELILAVLSGEITKKEQVKRWLDLHRSFAESPFLQSAKNNKRADTKDKRSQFRGG